MWHNGALCWCIHWPAAFQTNLKWRVRNQSWPLPALLYPLTPYLSFSFTWRQFTKTEGCPLVLVLCLNSAVFIVFLWISGCTLQTPKRQSWVPGLNNLSVPAMHRSFRTSAWIFQTNMNLSCFSSRQQNRGNSKNVHMAFTSSLRATEMTYSNVHISSGTGHSSSSVQASLSDCRFKLLKYFSTLKLSIMSSCAANWFSVFLSAVKRGQKMVFQRKCVHKCLSAPPSPTVRLASAGKALWWRNRSDVSDMMPIWCRGKAVPWCTSKQVAQFQNIMTCHKFLLYLVYRRETPPAFMFYLKCCLT